MNYMVQHAVDTLSQDRGDDMTTRSSNAAGSRLSHRRRTKQQRDSRRGAISSEGHYRTTQVAASQRGATEETGNLSFATLSHVACPPELDRTYHTLAPDPIPLRSLQEFVQHLGTKPRAQNPMSILNKTQDRVYPVNMHFIEKPSQIKLSMDFYDERKGLNTQCGPRR